MDPDRKQAEELQRREQDLKDRELSIRLRELEAEVNQPPPKKESPLKTVKHAETKGAVRPWNRTLFKIGKFLVLVVVAAVAIRIAAGLANILILLATVWVANKIFFEGERPKR